MERAKNGLAEPVNVGEGGSSRATTIMQQHLSARRTPSPTWSETDSTDASIDDKEGREEDKRGDPEMTELKLRVAASSKVGVERGR